MNFFERQALVRRQYYFLILLFAVALFGIIAAIAFVFMFLYHTPVICSLVVSSIAVFIVVGCATLYRMISLRAGGAAIAKKVGGTPLEENITDPQLQRLRNVVEEIAIASGVQVPEIFVLHDEPSINAFASGYSTSDAAITVTRGALTSLNRDELQGVIAHEFSHILNGDMRLNIKLVGVLFGITLISLSGQKMLTHGRFRGKGAAGMFLIALSLMIIGFIGLLCGRLIKAGINRQREYLADACAVQYTRQNLGLSGALKKIGGLPDGSKIANPNAEEFTHMFFSQGAASFSSMMATHPPVLDRIRALEPRFTDADLSELITRWSTQAPDSVEEDKLLDSAKTKTSMPELATTLAVTPLAIIAQVATTSHAHDYQRAHAIASGIPDILQQAARNYYGVIPLMCALLYSSDEKIQTKQEAEVTARHSDTMAAAAKAFYAPVSQLNPMQRLPLASLCFTALRKHPREELAKFIDTTHAIVHADEDITLYEYCLGHLLGLQVRDLLDPNKTGLPGTRKLKDATAETSTLIAVLAQVGESNTVDAEQAYLAGMARALPDVNIPYQAPPSFAAALSPIWPALDSLDPMSKQLLIEGLVTAINHDNQITLEEAELLRTVCASLHCPLPMMLDQI